MMMKPQVGLVRVFALPLLFVGCADDGAAAVDESSSSSTEATTSSSTEVTAMTLEVTSLDTTATTKTTTTMDPDTSSSITLTTDATTGEPVEVQAEVTTYDSQPMVADLELTLSAAGAAIVTHATDPGVSVSPLEGGDDTHLLFRVRGLAPDTMHTLQYEVSPVAGGDVTAGDTEFQTPAPLNGFVGAFVIETTDVEPAPLYHLSDYNPFPAGDFAGAIVIDPAGITRWFLSAPTKLAGPPAVWVGIKLREDGTIVHLEGDTFWIRDELGNIVSEIPATDLGVGVLHHDVLELPNGNFLALSMDFQQVDYADIGTTLVCGDTLIEFTPDGEVVWTWNSFDHLDPQRRRENFGDPIIDPLTGETASDWTHANGIVYDEKADTVTMSIRHQDWIIQIDRTDGSLVWTLGEDGDFTLADGERWFFHQHSPQWQDDGSLLFFDNGNGNPDILPIDQRSRALRMILDYDAMTTNIAWQDDEPLLQVPFAGDADRIDGGHILVTDSSIFGANGLFTRVRELEEGGDPERIWSMNTPDNRWIYRTTAHPRLVGQPLE